MHPFLLNASLGDARRTWDRMGGRGRRAARGLLKGADFRPPGPDRDPAGAQARDRRGLRGAQQREGEAHGSAKISLQSGRQPETESREKPPPSPWATDAVRRRIRTGPRQALSALTSALRALRRSARHRARKTQQISRDPAGETAEGR